VCAIEQSHAWTLRRDKGAVVARDVLRFLPSWTADHHVEVADLPYEATHREGADVEDGVEAIS
jgi:hypothetical protein